MSEAADKVERLREGLETGDRAGSERDREAILEFLRVMDLLDTEYSDYRRAKLVRHCCIMSEGVDGVDLVDVLDSREACETVLAWINRTYDNEETNRDYRSALRVFAKRVERRDEPPESVAWVPTGTSSTYDPMPREDELLTWEDDVEPMLEAARNTRDAALVATQFEAGLRGSELKTLTRGAVFDSEHGLGLHVDGKTGQRAVHLVVAVPYLTRWLADHPGDDDDPLWCKLTDGDALSDRMFYDILEAVAERAGVTKPVTPTNFRKSNTRWLVDQGLSQPEIEDRQGRTRGSDHTARYMARFGQESAEQRYAAAHGLEVETPEDTDRTPVSCPRCDRENPRDEDLCVWCGQALSPKAAEAADDFDDELVESAAVADADAARDLLELRDFLEEHPELKRKLL